MKPNTAYIPIAVDIADDSVWLNVSRNRRRHPPEVQLDVQAIKKIKKELRKPKQKQIHDPVQKEPWPVWRNQFNN